MMNENGICCWENGSLKSCFGLNTVAHDRQTSGLRKVYTIDPVSKDFVIKNINYKVPGEKTEYQLNYCPFCGGSLIEPKKVSLVE